MNHLQLFYIVKLSSDICCFYMRTGMNVRKEYFLLIPSILLTTILAGA